MKLSRHTLASTEQRATHVKAPRRKGSTGHHRGAFISRTSTPLVYQGTSIRPSRPSQEQRNQLNGPSPPSRRSILDDEGQVVPTLFYFCEWNRPSSPSAGRQLPHQPRMRPIAVHPFPRRLTILSGCRRTCTSPPRDRSHPLRSRRPIRRFEGLLSRRSR